MNVSCACGNVVYEGIGAPIVVASCYCDDCQEAGRRLEALPHAPPIRDAAGGTDLVLYRKDRLRYVKGRELLEAVRLKPTSPTRRMVASCCNSAMHLDFEKGHWVSIFRGRVADAPPLDLRIQTRFVPAGTTIPGGAPAYARFPPSLLGKVLLARVAMMFSRPTAAS
jgi:hypothetical protein